MKGKRRGSPERLLALLSRQSRPSRQKRDIQSGERTKTELALKFDCMAQLQTLHLAHLPPDLAVHVALYTEVQNAPYLRDQLLQGNQGFEYALVDANVVCGSIFNSRMHT